MLYETYMKSNTAMTTNVVIIQTATQTTAIAAMSAVDRPWFASPLGSARGAVDILSKPTSLYSPLSIASYDKIFTTFHIKSIIIVQDYKYVKSTVKFIL